VKYNQRDPMSATVTEQEDRFLARCPRFADALDPAREAQYVRDRLAVAERRDDPFPYVWIEDVLSSQLYDALDAAWPHVDAFPAEERENRRDLVPRPPGLNPKDRRTATYEDLPAPIKAVWDFFVIEINRGVVGPWLRQVFASTIDERIGLIERSWQSGTLKKDYAPPYTVRMNVGRLMMRARGFRLHPHADALPYLATALYYFPDEAESTDLGTTLYQTHGALSDEAIVAESRTMYFSEAGIETTAAFRAPFRRNALLAFVNSARSAHGMEITAPGVWRRAYQSHLSIKSDRHHL
jgi:hypothetical protein